MGGLNGVYIFDGKGRLILSRNYRNTESSQVCKIFHEYIIYQDEASLKPVFVVDGTIFCWIFHNGVYFLATSTQNFNVLSTITFLHHLLKVLINYFRVVSDESIRDNFVITYELLDEMADFGYPQSTEIHVLKEFIKNTANRLIYEVGPPSAMTNAISWRQDGIKHKKNEIFLDVIETLDILISSSGSILRSEIQGCLKMKSFLSGMPECKLGLNDKIFLDKSEDNTQNVGIEDVKLHQCVRLNKFDTDKTILFIPPDGEFDLMTYRLNSPVKPLFWVDVSVHNRSSSRIDFSVKTRSQFKTKSVANNVEFQIPVPTDVDCPSFTVSVGTAAYKPQVDAMIWSIRQFQGQKEYTMTASFGLPSISDESRDNFVKKPVRVRFEIPYFTVSGLTTRYLKVIEKSGYRALTWVRYISKSGDYQIRLS
ncbi:AP-1 complex subunit mu [Babesia microti strain RI]|uniref:AP-1 complex subunit mu n=1 Tax=Babesia microti (strain RI) TaxID=1133968 RepID=A0A0K3AQ86_BABMR|nr:AP-1 complex subunit mu [Babesia microti strain RI]CTQ40798.1 AP-1 complex subunit mu [Babesia microti strain RI]|eukprot:XP_012648809.1 AP-1 complex subunit mu [Babesia microti strain RI]